MDGWPKPVACAALATVLASSGDHFAAQGKVPGLTEAQTGLRTFALVALSRAAWDVLRRRWQGTPGAPQESCPRKLQVELEASHEELQMAKSELEAAQLKMEHTEARLKRSETLRQQLQGSFTQVLHRLDSTERKESKLHQEILRIMTVATGDEGASPSAAEAPQGLAPSTPASSQPSDVELESGEEQLEEVDEADEDEVDEVEEPASKDDIEADDAVELLEPSEVPRSKRSREPEVEPSKVEPFQALEAPKAPEASEPRPPADREVLEAEPKSKRRRRSSSECGVHLVIRRSL